MKTIIIGIAGGTGGSKGPPDRKAAGPFWCERGQRSQPRQLLQAPRRAALRGAAQKLNYDHPDNDTPLMVPTCGLRAGHPVQVPVYDHTIHNRSDKTVTVQRAGHYRGGS